MGVFKRFTYFGWTRLSTRVCPTITRFDTRVPQGICTPYYTQGICIPYYRMHTQISQGKCIPYYSKHTRISTRVCPNMTLVQQYPRVCVYPSKHTRIVTRVCSNITSFGTRVPQGVCIPDYSCPDIYPGMPQHYHVGYAGYSRTYVYPKHTLESLVKYELRARPLAHGASCDTVLLHQRAACY